MGLRHEDGGAEPASARVVDPARQRGRAQLEANVFRILETVGKVGRLNPITFARNPLDVIPTVVRKLDWSTEIVGEKVDSRIGHVGREEVGDAFDVSAKSGKVIGVSRVVPGGNFSQSVKVVRSGEHVKDSVPPIGSGPSVIKSELVHDARNWDVEFVDEFGRVQQGIFVSVEMDLPSCLFDEKLFSDRLESDVHQTPRYLRQLLGCRSDCRCRNVEKDEFVVQTSVGSVGDELKCSDLKTIEIVIRNVIMIGKIVLLLHLVTFYQILIELNE